MSLHDSWQDLSEDEQQEEEDDDDKTTCPRWSDEENPTKQKPSDSAKPRTRRTK